MGRWGCIDFCHWYVLQGLWEESITEALQYGFKIGEVDICRSGPVLVPWGWNGTSVHVVRMCRDLWMMVAVIILHDPVAVSSVVDIGIPFFNRLAFLTQYAFDVQPRSISKRQDGLDGVGYAGCVGIRQEKSWVTKRKEIFTLEDECEDVPIVSLNLIERHWTTPLA